MIKHQLHFKNGKKKCIEILEKHHGYDESIIFVFNNRFFTYDEITKTGFRCFFFFLINLWITR